MHVRLLCLNIYIDPLQGCVLPLAPWIDSLPRWDVIVGKKWKINLLILSHGWGLELIRDEQALKEHQAR